MAWNSTWPDGSKSVKTNQPTGAANTTYTKTTMNVDHYWDDSGNNDGHHQWVQMTQSGTAAVPVDITLATGMEGGFYSKAKSAAEATANQDVQPFFIDNKAVGVAGITQVMQLLGIRACCTFNGRGTNGVCTITYNHNITSVTRTAKGQYTVVYADNFPSVNYLVHAGQTGTNIGSLRVQGYVSALSEVKTVSTLKLVGNSATGVIIDPGQGWFFCFGG